MRRLVQYYTSRAPISKTSVNLKGSKSLPLEKSTGGEKNGGKRLVPLQKLLASTQPMMFVNHSSNTQLYY